HLLRRGAQALEVPALGPGWTPPADTVWLDLVSPTRDEEVAVERALSLDLPTREEMAEIEPSSRLYQHAGATFMTASLLARREDRRADSPVTFALSKGLLVTLRYDELKAFQLYAERAPSLSPQSGSQVLFGLLDAVIERLADLLEHSGDEVEAVSAAIF